MSVRKKIYSCRAQDALDFHR